MGLNIDRLNDLFQMGLRFNGQEFEGEINGVYINFHHTEITCDSDKTWNTKINKVKEHLKQNII